MGYIRKVEIELPKLLHGLYRYASASLGVDETTARICCVMNNRSKELFPHCEVRANLKLNSYFFGTFFIATVAA